MRRELALGMSAGHILQARLNLNYPYRRSDAGDHDTGLVTALMHMRSAIAWLQTTR
jgi:hypothetical protein